MTEEFVVEKEQIRVVISESEKYLVNVPSLAQAKKFQSELTGCPPLEAFSKVQSFLAELGLPLEVQEEHMTPAVMYDLWERVNGAKKK